MKRLIAAFTLTLIFTQGPARAAGAYDIYPGLATSDLNRTQLSPVDQEHLRSAFRLDGPPPIGGQIVPAPIGSPAPRWALLICSSPLPAAEQTRIPWWHVGCDPFRDLRNPAPDGSYSSQADCEEFRALLGAPALHSEAVQTMCMPQ